MHAQSLRVLGYLLEAFLYIDMLIAHWVRQFPKCTLLLEHIPIVIPITRPSVLIGLVFLFKDLQGFLKTYAFPRYQFRNKNGKLGNIETLAFAGKGYAIKNANPALLPYADEQLPLTNEEDRAEGCRGSFRPARVRRIARDTALTASS